jgi:hypothetical protein
MFLVGSMMIVGVGRVWMGQVERVGHKTPRVNTALIYVVFESSTMLVWKVGHVRGVGGKWLNGVTMPQVWFKIC